jgi:peptidoglycan-N-acetylglucosamine deacetylase
MHSPRRPRRPPRLPRALAAVASLLVALLAAGCGGGASEEDRSGDGPSKPARDTPRAEGPAPAPVAPTLIENAPRTARRVALTFDADMTRAKLAEIEAGGAGSVWYDRRIVAELERTRTPATIFVSGLWAKAHPDAARALARSPLFELENHSLDHRAFSSPCFGLEVVGSPREKREEVVLSSEMIERTTGERPRYFRFPGGCHDDEDLRLVAAAGEQPVGWDVVSGDVGQSDPAIVAREVLEGVRPGSIVVMHLVGAPNAPATAEALEEILPGLRQRGYQPVTLRELLSPAGASRGAGG